MCKTAKSDYTHIHKIKNIILRKNGFYSGYSSFLVKLINKNNIFKRSFFIYYCLLFFLWITHINLNNTTAYTDDNFVINYCNLVAHLGMKCVLNYNNNELYKLFTKYTVNPNIFVC